MERVPGYGRARKGPRRNYGWIVKETGDVAKAWGVVGDQALNQSEAPMKGWSAPAGSSRSAVARPLGSRGPAFPVKGGAPDQLAVKSNSRSRVRGTEMPPKIDWGDVPLSEPRTR